MADAIEVVVVGAGYIGLEVADQFVHRGLKVTVVELQAQVIPLVDREIAEPLNRGSERNGVRLELGRGVAAIEETDGAVTGVTLADGTRLSAGLVQMCIGVRPNVDLAVDAGLTIRAGGGIATDAYMRTSDPDIYAVGDAAERTRISPNSRSRMSARPLSSKSFRYATHPTPSTSDSTIYATASARSTPPDPRWSPAAAGSALTRRFAYWHSTASRRSTISRALRPCGTLR